MARPGISKEQRERERKALKQAYKRAKESGLVSSQESLMGERKRSQGLFGRWLRGDDPIPDIDMLWLGRRLNFDPFSLRPSLREYREFFESEEGESVRIDDLPEDVQRTIKTIKNAYVRKKPGNAENDANGS